MNKILGVIENSFKSINLLYAKELTKNYNIYFNFYEFRLNLEIKINSFMN